MAGRRPKDNVVKMVTGTRGADKQPPKIPAEAPPCPSYFDAKTKKVWNEVVNDLERVGRLTRCDSGTIEAYVLTLARVRKMQAEVQKHGEIYEARTKDGMRFYKNPAMDVLNQSLTQLRNYAVEMGCTPASRGKVTQLGLPGLDGNEFNGF